MRHLVVGIGSIGARHVANIHRLFPDHYVATVDNDPAKNATYSAFVPKSAYEDALVYICTPTSQHLIDLGMAISSGAKAVFIEKPLAEAGIVIEPKPNIPVVCAYQYRFHPIIRQLALNPPDSLHIAAMDNLLSRYGPTALTTMASHAIDYALYINGPAKNWMTSDRGRIADISIMHTSGRETVIYCNIDYKEGRILQLQVGRREEYELLEVPPLDSMYEDEFRAWIRYVETGSPGNLCLWDDAMLVQEIMNGSKV